MLSAQPVPHDPRPHPPYLEYSAPTANSPACVEALQFMVQVACASPNSLPIQAQLVGLRLHGGDDEGNVLL